MGFEPLIFPDDYYKDQDSPEYVALKATADFKDGVGIMDGGIADNQGIKSMLKHQPTKGCKGSLQFACGE